MADISKEDIPALCMAVGFVSINWALMERHMDNIVHLIFSRLGGVPGQKEKPLSFKKKIVYLRKAFRKAPLANYKDKLASIVADALALAATRHTLMHGTMYEIDGTTLVMEKLEVTTLNYEVTVSKFDFANFPDLTARFANLTSRWTAFDIEIFDAFQSGAIKP